MSSPLRILWVKSGPLHPLDTGGKKRTHGMLVELNRRHEVTYLALSKEGEKLHPDEEESPYASRKIWIPWREADRGSPRWILEVAWNLVASRLPYALQKYRSSGMEEAILRLAGESRFDLVVCDFLTPAINFEAIRHRLRVPTVLFQHNIEAMIWKRLAAGRKNPLARWYFKTQASRMERQEKRLSEIFGGIITVSPEDSQVARREYGLDNILGDVPAGVDTGYFTPSERAGGSPPTLGFLGSMDWMPNIEAVRWFVDDIFPLVEETAHEARLLVIGRNPPHAIQELGEAHPQIEITGTVDDVRPWLARCDLLVVPLLSGGGTRIKIMEALAAGLPVVSTTVGAEGLGLVDGEHLVIADSADAFAGAVAKLIGDGEQRERLGRAGRRLVEEEFSWKRATETFIRHAKRLIERTGPPGC